MKMQLLEPGMMTMNIWPLSRGFAHLILTTALGRCVLLFPSGEEHKAQTGDVTN